MKRFFVILICLVTLFSTFVFAVDFTDLPSSHWAYENVMTLVDNGVINGYTDGTFKPSKSVTYGEFMKLMICAIVPDSIILPSMMEGEHWAERYVNTAEFYKIIPVDSIREEELNNQISRIEMAKFLSLVDAWYYGEEYDNSMEMNFTDIDFLPESYVNYLNRIFNRGYVIGNPDGRFNPDGYLSRAEMVTIILRVINVNNL